MGWWSPLAALRRAYRRLYASEIDVAEISALINELSVEILPQAIERVARESRPAVMRWRACDCPPGHALLSGLDAASRAILEKYDIEEPTTGFRVASRFLRRVSADGTPLTVIGEEVTYGVGYALDADGRVYSIETTGVPELAFDSLAGYLLRRAHVAGAVDARAIVRNLRAPGS